MDIITSNHSYPIIGVLDPTKPDLYFNLLRLGASLAFKENGFHGIATSVSSLLPIEDLEGLIIQNLKTPRGQELYDIKSRKNLPIVTVHSKTNDHPSVQINLLPGIKDALTRLKARGKTRIALVKGPQQHPQTSVRGRAFQEAMEQVGLEFDPDFAIEGSSNHYDILAPIMSLLNRDKRCDAIFCFSDRQAMACIQAAKQASLSVPEDLAVIGCGNISRILNTSEIPLSTITFPLYTVGYEAATLLASIIRNPSEPAGDKLISSHFVERESTLGKAWKDTARHTGFTNGIQSLERILSIGGALNSAKKEELLNEFRVLPERDPNLLKETSRLFLEGIEHGLDPFLCHNIVLDLGLSLGAWKTDSPSSIRKTDLLEKLYSNNTTNSIFFDQYYERTEYDSDRAFAPLQQISDNDSDIYSYLDELQVLLRKTNTKRCGLVVLPELDESGQGGVQTNAEMWKIDDLSINGPTEMSLKLNINPQTFFSDCEELTLLEVKSLIGRNGLIGALIIDADNRFGLFFEKIVPIIAEKIDRSLLIKSLKRQRLQLETQAELLNQQRNLAESASKTIGHHLVGFSKKLKDQVEQLADGMREALDADPDKRVTRNLSSAIEASDMLFDSLRKINEYTHLETGNIELERNSFSINDLVTAAVEKRRGDSNSNYSSIACNIKTPLASNLIGDAKRLEQLINLLFDELTDERGEGDLSLILNTRLLGSASIEATFELRHQNAETPASNEPASQLKEQSRNPDSSINLAIALKLAQLMHGRVWTDRIDSDSASYFLVLRFETEREDSNIATTTHRADTDWSFENNGSPKLLLVDDDSESLIKGQSQLADWGFDVLVAFSGEEAIEFFKSRSFDVILLNLNMRGIDGLETAKAIRETEIQKVDYSSPTIIATSSRPTINDMHLCRETGISGLIAKPLDRDELLSTLPEISESTE